MIRQAGEHALLVETENLAISHRLDALLRADRPPAVVDIVPGPATVLVVAPGADLVRLRDRLSSLLATATTTTGAIDGELVEVPAVYDGVDLPDVASLTGLTVDEVIIRHTASPFIVGWLGFAPGFAYLTGLDPRLHVPRLATPRTSVPAGSVAIAGPYAAVYPSSSPGGWRLLGRTSLQVWEASSADPALLRPGMRVRFRAT